MNTQYQYNYKEEIKSPEWQRVSAEIKRRDNWTCQLCGSKNKQLHVHHRYYRQGLHYWDYPDNALITYCEDCHKMVSINEKETKEEQEQYIRQAVNEALRDHLTPYEIAQHLHYILGKLRRCEPLYGNSTSIYPTQTETKRHEYELDDFMTDVRSYSERYEVGYLDSFIDYWTERTNNVYRFQIEPKFLFKSAIEKWKDLRPKIMMQREFVRTIDNAKQYAIEQLKRRNLDYKQRCNWFLYSRFLGGYMLKTDWFYAFLQSPYEVNRPINIGFFKTICEFICFMQEKQKELMQSIDNLPDDITVHDFFRTHGIETRIGKNNPKTVRQYILEHALKLEYGIYEDCGIAFVKYSENISQHFQDIERIYNTPFHCGLGDNYYGKNISIEYTFQIPAEVMYAMQGDSLIKDEDLFKLGVETTPRPIKYKSLQEYQALLPIRKLSLKYYEPKHYDTHFKYV